MAETDRKAAEKVVFDFLEGILPGSPNKQIYEEFFASMDDEAFKKYVDDVDAGRSHLVVIAPENAAVLLNFPRNLQYADSIGHSFYKRIWLTDPLSGSKYLSNDEYLVVRLPLKRQAQFLTEKISIPEDNLSINNLTGQATGKSKGSTISNPELQVLNALGLEYSSIEMIKFRGGDLIGFNAMNNQIFEGGQVSLETLDSMGTNVKALTTLSTILTSMHLSNTLLRKQ